MKNFPGLRASFCGTLFTGGHGALRALALGLALAVVPLAGCDSSPVAEKAREWAGMDTVDAGVVATVNGIPIYLRQVEALSDMNSPTQASGQIATFDELRADYAANLNLLIIQILVHQELEARGMLVSDSEVRNLESLVSASYDESPGQAFDPYIEEAGFTPELWRDQLRARLELERWQAELAHNATVSAGEVEDYARAHPSEMRMPAQVTYLLVSGGQKAEVEAAAKSGQWDVPALEARGLEVRQLHGALAAASAAWQKDLSELARGQASAVRQTGETWRYVLLLDRQPARARTPVEIYAYVERVLAEQKLPEIFDEWLGVAVGAATIHLAKPLLPRNVAKPAPRPEPAAAVLETGPGLDGENAQGEVEDEATP